MVRNIAEKAGEEVMTQFDQRGQKVNTQYNAGRDIHFGAVQTPVDLIAELEKLNGQIVQAQQAKKPDPDKKTLVDHLSAAKAVLDNITAASGLVTALVGAIEVVQKLFS